MNAVEPSRPLVEIERDIRALKEARENVRLSFGDYGEHIGSGWRKRDELQAEIDILTVQHRFQQNGKMFPDRRR